MYFYKDFSLSPFIYVCAPAWLYVPHVHVAAYGGQWAMNPLELDF